MLVPTSRIFTCGLSWWSSKTLPSFDNFSLLLRAPRRLLPKFLSVNLTPYQLLFIFNPAHLWLIKSPLVSWPCGESKAVSVMEFFRTMCWVLRCSNLSLGWISYSTWLPEPRSLKPVTDWTWIPSVYASPFPSLSLFEWFGRSKIGTHGVITRENL